jgi:hypothetical protein
MSKTAKSAELVKMYTKLLADRLAERGIDAFIVVPLPDPGRKDPKSAELIALAEELGKTYASTEGVYGGRRVKIFKVGEPDIDTALLVFIEPAGQKQCTICELCIDNECRLVETAEETARLGAGGVITPDKLARLAEMYKLRPEDRMERVEAFIKRAFGESARIEPPYLPGERLAQYFERVAPKLFTPRRAVLR